ncbi:PGPGW domain-containing protein [Pseudokineococcus lusitanus]|uniref:Putative transmembrane protein PGPGW n=1 Tax=Pseudokineococcus lusitanus TaxID=763993 RepID=A0A3N1HQU1_9ACTN|nr:PGPGW domain-containing protein [Pseudokineococcus lusitanus]ROP44752.1 putative transmembrane protein PGPGW [Pseudokineococcus lusitanus]
MRRHAATLVTAVVGGLLTLTGIALLVLPGPGMVLVALGLALLATEFAWARKPLGYARNRAEAGVRQVGRHRTSALMALTCAAALAGTGVVRLSGVSVPFVSELTAVLLVVSGIFLVGTLLYARSVVRRAPV